MTHRHAKRNHCILNHVGFNTTDSVLILFTESEGIKYLNITMHAVIMNLQLILQICQIMLA